MERTRYPPRCDQELFESGIQIATLTGPSWDIENLIVKARDKSCQRIDWHYIGGRACVIALGNVQLAAITLNGLLPCDNIKGGIAIWSAP